VGSVTGMYFLLIIVLAADQPSVFQFNRLGKDISRT
jgi:hypothetical protein